MPTGRKKTYSRNWNGYNKAVIYELPLFIRWMRKFVDELNVEKQWKGIGRPPENLKDVLKAIHLKEKLRLAARPCVGWLLLLKEPLGIKEIPSFNTILAYQRKPEIRLYLNELRRRQNLCLKGEEHDFSIDSHGVSTSMKMFWNDIRENHRKRKKFLKHHATIGVRFKIIAASTVTRGTAGDSPQLKEHVPEVASIHRINDFDGDSSYLSRNNCNDVASHGGTPYFKVKKNSVSNQKGSLAWRKMVELSRNDPEEFNRHYHKRSNSESMNASFERKYSNHVNSKLFESQTNEIQIRVVNYNFGCLSRAVFEYGVVFG